MNLKQIREECWNMTRDTAALIDQDRLWTTSEMNSYINRIYRWIARETRCIKDSVTPAICQIAVTPVDYTTLTSDDGIDYIWVNDTNSPMYHQNVAPYLFNLDTRIIDIDEVKWNTQQWRLIPVSVSKWMFNPIWEQTVGTPTEYALDVSNNRLALGYRSLTADILRLSVRRLPLSDLVKDTDEPEFRSSYHDFFINGVLWLMFSKQDAETLNKVKAEEFHISFLRDVDEIKQQETILNQHLRNNFSMAAFR